MSADDGLETSPVFGFVDVDWDVATLCCPHCKNANLHHKRVVVFDRLDDEDKTIRVEVCNGLLFSHRMPSEQTGNPSGRRQGLVISFWCETCQADPIELTLAQHKGATRLGWRWKPPLSS